MSVLFVVGIAATAFVIGLVAAVLWARRNRRSDLGSVSAAWTTEHTIGYRGGDAPH